MAGSSESFSNRALWQFITGSGILRPRELITLELTKAKTKILNGLLNYHKQKTPSGEQLKKDKNITGLQLEFTLKLSKFLDLDEVESYSLFCSFLVNEFRGSKKNLQQLLSQDRHVQGLILKIRDYYYTERLYGLRCLHHIFNYWPVAEHPYRESYAEFLDSLLENKQLLTKILEQFDSICQEQLPTYETRGLLMVNLCLQRLIYYTEYLDNNQPNDLVLLFYR
ncbi:hypothetical protein LOTGIDRAFT_239571 [Lottia gigantea]|uniref:Nucleoporin Nup188 N-terminal domain-containing protein n=1 Tax=Lottia gigantea TaxID=225164 RepID=V4AC62_LOTGI|nr:hypothetical protein LOTGIDRAFT_239571 [Lottia gigantea]ESO92695.1 hypothetical protein LOTGIDRAFT_239571 [Lottia gigantea]